MAVYVDEAIWRWAGRNWCHLLADDIEDPDPWWRLTHPLDLFGLAG